MELDLDTLETARLKGESYDGGSYAWDPQSIHRFMTFRSVEQLKEKGGVKGLAKLLRSDTKKGLSVNKHHEDRKEFYGVNVLPQPEPESWFSLFLDSWKDEAVIILTVSAIVALISGVTEELLHLGKNGWIDGVAILVACLIVSTVTATNDYIKELQFRKLREETDKKKTVRVIRSGTEHKILLQEILVGDVVMIHSGDKLPADGILIPGFDELLVNESEVTGEVEELVKDKKDPFLLSGCPVKKGSGAFLVLAVGPNTEWGRTMQNIDENGETPLQVKLNVLVRYITYVGTVVAIFVFLVLFGWYVKDHIIYPTAVVNCTDDPKLVRNVSVDEEGAADGVIRFLCNATNSPETPAELVPNQPFNIRVPSKWEPRSLVEVLKAFIVAVTIIVVAVPEGLPLAVTVSLAYSMQQMLKDQNFVRHLAACETMGGATNICSDKTGTLTENRMQVIAGWVAGTVWERFEDLRDLLGQCPKVSELFINSISLNVEDGKLERITVRGQEVVNFIGSSTECAFLVLAEKLGANPDNLQKIVKPVKYYQFNSDRKRMSRAFPVGDSGVIRLYVKGASELVLGLCDRVLESNGSVVPLPEKQSRKLMRIGCDFQAQGLRTLAIAYRDFNGPQKWSPDGSGFEEQLILIGLLAIEDPLRPEVTEAIAKCVGAGITVRMITGDNILTAKKIAIQCGILTADGVAMEGREFRDMSDEERTALLANKSHPLQVLARAVPNDKLVLVKVLKSLGEVVAVTGDGTNDGPALKEADVGLAMGISGTDVAREMADIIIMDDNFASIVVAVKWGRSVYDNIRKFLQFQLTVNVVALLTAFIGAVSAYGTPLTALQLLWVNLIMDTMAALALGTEKPQERLLYRKPYGREGKLITATMWRNIFGQSFFQVLIMCLLLYVIDPDTRRHYLWNDIESGQFIEGPNLHYTFIFNTFVFLQVFNEINSRKVNKGIPREIGA
eukprot:TRINITY_DN923_c0_g1_i8.p1 TRINITY_DN923_c0_g1~~TRINITY_DN923_c0_g1_i8.p1  ORF type:complete len:984 (-),score=211.52 TRINITY_DN923_c0_g1_i8:464-3337(-)